MNSDDFEQQGASGAQDEIKGIMRPGTDLAKAGARRAGRAAMHRVGDAARGAGRIAGKALKRGAANVGRTASKAIGKGVGALLKNPLVLKVLIVVGVILLLIFIVAGGFDYEQEERGSSSRVDHINGENPFYTTAEGYQAALALTEPQALLNAYYRYLACNSVTKLAYVDGKMIELQFNDPDETSDFSSLSSSDNIEDLFYLSPYFIKMADEIIHQEQQYYPEQIIKPVYSQICALESDPSKLYITGLPIVDDGSDNAKRLMEGETPYAIAESLVSAEGDGELKAKANPDATWEMIAKSDPYIYDKTKEIYKKVEGDKVPGFWDYGFGAILQYEPMTVDRHIQCSNFGFTFHVHLSYTGIWHSFTKTIEKDADGEDVEVWTETVGDPVVKESCIEEPLTYTLPDGQDLSSLTEEMIMEEIGNLIAEYQDSIELPQTAEHEEHESYEEILNPEVILNCWPQEQIQYILSTGFEEIHSQINKDDAELATLIFDNEDLQTAFGNGTKQGEELIKATSYPLKVPVVTAAATFSGNMRFVYQQGETSEELGHVISTADSFQEGWRQDCTDFVYQDTEACPIFTGSITRGGNLITQGPVLVSEITVPTGFLYLEQYAKNYEAYVPLGLQGDVDFKKRVMEPLGEGINNTKAALEADGVKGITVLDFLLNMELLTKYYNGEVTAVSEDKWQYTYSILDAAEQAKMSDMDCTIDQEGEIELLAKFIAAEAGNSKLNQLMTGAVVINRVASDAYPNTIIGVISDPYSGFASWNNGTMKDIEPTEEQKSSAKQVITGIFSIPKNILYASDIRQGSTYMTVIDTTGTRYYTYPTKANLADKDVFEREEIPKRGEQTKALANALITMDQTGQIEIVGYKPGSLYSTEEFNMREVLDKMRKIADGEKLDFWESIVEAVAGTFRSIADQILAFQNMMNKFIMPDPPSDDFYHYAASIPSEDIDNIVFQSMTFIDRDIYTNIRAKLDPLVLQFLFVGGRAGFGSGLNSGSWTLVPGVGSAFDGFKSPTNTFYSITEPWNSTSNTVTIGVPSGKSVQTVSDCTVSDVIEEEDGTVTVELTGTTPDGQNYVLTYMNLSQADVAKGDVLEKGTTVGVVAGNTETAETGGLKMSMTLDGERVDPSNYFYQSVASAGVSFNNNLLNEDGTINQAAVDQLETALNAANSRANVFDTWHQTTNTGIIGQCTWWACGRAKQFCAENGTEPVNGFLRGYGNGADYYANGGTQWAVGQLAKPGSWIVWGGGTGRYAGCGHVAFVEAVADDGTIVISQSGSGYWDDSPTAGYVNVQILKNSGTSASPNYIYGSAYSFRGFVYLSQPLG